MMSAVGYQNTACHSARHAARHAACHTYSMISTWQPSGKNAGFVFWPNSCSLTLTVSASCDTRAASLCSMQAADNLRSASSSHPASIVEMISSIFYRNKQRLLRYEKSFCHRQSWQVVWSEIFLNNYKLRIPTRYIIPYSNSAGANQQATWEHWEDPCPKFWQLEYVT